MAKIINRITQPSVETLVRPRKTGPIITKDEPKESSNAGMNLALVLSAVLAAALIVWAVVAKPQSHFTDVSEPAVQKMSTKASATDNEKLRSLGDESRVGNQPVQGDAITSGTFGSAITHRDASTSEAAGASR